MENSKDMKKIKQGVELVAINNCKGALTIGKSYIIKEVSKYDKLFAINSDINPNHYFTFKNKSLYFDFPKPKKDPIVKTVTDKFKQRSKLGIEKYGTTLKENEKDNFLEHLQQELMDATLYVEKIKEQNATYFTLLGKYNNLKEHCEKLEKKTMTAKEMIDALNEVGYTISWGK
jgi:hypothetical protein